MQNEVKVLQFQEIGDERGHLVVIEGGIGEIPFEPKRVFYIYGSDETVVRGRHANKKTEFILINISGTSKVRVCDGKNERIIELDKPHEGLYLPALVWKDMYDFSKDSILLVLASEHYDAGEYIRDFDEFLQFIKETKK